ncbi:WYL domain-containing protein [Kineococcus sp. GCM10028916]|uniref:WYL domain-containing protein n=1 Tax=Kineococcus sp. GCM10028916 TaxID=3273394 RepID=UPI00363B7E21
MGRGVGGNLDGSPNGKPVRSRGTGRIESAGAVSAGSSSSRSARPIATARSPAWVANSWTLDPLGLVAKGVVWYLVGKGADGERLFRVDRVLDVELLDDTVADDLPELAAVWARLRAEVERPDTSGTVVRMRVAAGDAGLLLRIADAQLLDEPRVGAHGEEVEITATFRALPAARAVLLGLGTTVHVLEPAELVADLVRTARDVLERYGDPGVQAE